MAAHHRHVAGVIAHAVFLFVGLIVLLIDNDETKIGIGQEQRRARADHDRDFAVGNGAPGAGALARRQFRMPLGRPGAETRGKTVEELGGQRNLRHENEALAAAADRVRHRLEINLGLAGAGDAVEQSHRIAVRRHRCFQLRGGSVLAAGEIRLHKIRIGLCRDRLRRQHHGFERAFVDEPIDHAGAHARLSRRVALAAHHAVGEQRERALACRRHPLRRRTGKTHADALAFGAEILAHAQTHPQHHAARADGIIRDPVDETAQFRAQRRQIELLLDILEPVVEPGIGFWVIRPDHGGRLAGAERHANDVARREREVLGHPVGIGPVEGDRDQDIDDAFGHDRLSAPTFRRFRSV